jgi:hypothetical protein
MSPWRRAANPSGPGGWSGSAARLTGYTHDEAGNRPQLCWGIYLDMVGHKTVLESIRATVQARQPKRQRQKLFLQGRPVYPLASHYSQTWQHLPDYGAYHATLIADPALPGKWQPGEEVVYLLVFDGSGGTAPEEQSIQMLTKRLSEALPIPILDEWNASLWEVARNMELVVDLQTRGDCQEGHIIQLSENAWKEVVIRLLKGRKISISSGV